MAAPFLILIKLFHFEMVVSHLIMDDDQNHILQPYMLLVLSVLIHYYLMLDPILLALEPFHHILLILLYLLLELVYMLLACYLYKIHLLVLHTQLYIVLYNLPFPILNFHNILFELDLRILISHLLMVHIHSHLLLLPPFVLHILN